jgi:hypothetical protein
MKKTSLGVFLLFSLILWPAVATAGQSVEFKYWRMVSEDVANLAVDVKAKGFPGGELAFNVYLDDEFLWREKASTDFEIDDFPLGLHTVAVVLADRRLGHYLELSGSSQRAVVSLQAEHACDGPGDPGCDDGNECSLDFCALQEGVYRCEFGVKPWSGNCCTSRFDCKIGWVCVSGRCEHCSTDIQCVDPNGCTTDRCQNGVCVHEPVPGCCDLEGACDDLDPCTVDDQCENGLCTGTPISCDVESDADAGHVGGDSTGSGCGAGTGSRTEMIMLFVLLLGLEASVATVRRYSPRD